MNHDEGNKIKKKEEISVIIKQNLLSFAIATITMNTKKESNAEQITKPKRKEWIQKQNYR